MTRPLVTVFGGSGFIGRHLVRHLAKNDFLVRVAVRHPDSALFLKTAGAVGQIELAAANLGHAPSVAAAAEDADAVINLVGILYEKGRRTFRRLHVEGASAVAQAAAQAGAKRLIHVSAIGADADAPSAYARSKAEGEDAVRAAFPDATVLRPSVVFGPEDDFFNRFAEMARFSPALPVIGGPDRARLQPVYVGDVAAAAMACLKDRKTAGKTFELGGPRIYTFREVLQLVLDEIRRRRLILTLPRGLAMIEAWFLEKLPVPPLTRDQVRLLDRDNVAGEDMPGLADLGIAPTPVKAVLADYLDRYRPPSRQGRWPA